MISKDYIRELKDKGNGAILHFVNDTKENNKILFFLEEYSAEKCDKPVELKYFDGNPPL